MPVTLLLFCLYRFLKSKVALLQTELEAGKNLNDTLEKENVKHVKKIKKLTTQIDKSTDKVVTLETSLKSLQDKYAVAEQSLKVSIDFGGFLVMLLKTISNLAGQRIDDWRTQQRIVSIKRRTKGSKS